MDLVPHMAQLKAAGVASIKIEGRLRTPEYAAAAVTACRAPAPGSPMMKRCCGIFSPAPASVMPIW